MSGWATWLKPELVWFLVGLVFLLAEFAMPGLVIFFFGLGAWLVAIVCLLTDVDLMIQLITFLVSSVLILILFRQRLKSLFYGKGAGFENLVDKMDDYRGQRVVVIKAISPRLKGKVEFHGTNWDAEADVDIPAGAVSEIVEKNNLTLKVKPV